MFKTGKSNGNLWFPLFVVIIFGLMSVVNTNDIRYYETHYNPYLHMFVVHTLYILLGLVIGCEHFIEQTSVRGKWYIKTKRITLGTLPLLVFYLAMMLNLFDVLIKYRIIINDFFIQSIGLLIGYTIITSFVKQD